MTPLLEVDGYAVSSSLIRELVLGGWVDRANTLLGRPFRHTGVVVRAGDRAGGLPTSSVCPQGGCVTPGHGVYICLANGQPAVVTVGSHAQCETEPAQLMTARLIDGSTIPEGAELQLDFIERIRSGSLASR